MRTGCQAIYRRPSKDFEDQVKNGRVSALALAGSVPSSGSVAVAEGLNRAGVESRAGCHCATLAHRELGLDPPASAAPT